MSHCISTNTILTALKLNGPASLFPRNRSFPINQATRINQDNVSVSSDHQRARTLEPCTHNDPGDPQPGSTLGAHLARRLVQIGVTDVFAVPGDSNVVLLDHLIAEPGLRLIGCCNELNAGYAADGYARARGVGVVAVTFTVGGLSVVNAVAGAYSESLPLICIVGGPSSNYYGKDLTLHHTVGLPDFSQELRCYESVTCHQAVVKELGNAREQIDRAIRAALEESKPVYISICCNLAGIPHPSFHRKPFPIFPLPRKTNPVALQAAVDAATKLLTAAKSPILLGGAKLRAGKSLEAFTQLAKATGYTTAVMPAAKGMISEDHPQFIGTFWDGVTMSLCADIVNAADACLYAGPIFYDFYSSKKKNSIIVHPDHVEVGESLVLSGILMEDFLRALSLRFQGNTRASENRLSRCPPVGFSPPARPREPLKVEVLFREIQRTISSDSVVVSDVGDSWLNTQNLRLPPGCGYEVQLHYASMGWSVGATLGYAQAAPEKRVIACMGDGSFQMAAQEVSTMLRCGQKSIIFVINNGGYTTEALLHDGPYNVIKNWDYTGLVGAIQNEEGKLWTAKVRYEDELVAAIDVATGDKKDCLCFIEAIVDKTDTSKELVEMTSRLATANGAPPVAC